MITCGEFGGVTADGQPCGKPAGSGTPRKGFGPCKAHYSVPIDRYPDPRKHAFLVAFCTTGNVTRAAAAARIDRTTHYVWLKDDEQYVRAFEQAREIAADELEAEAIRRARHGTEKVVYYQGEEIGREREYSDVLLIFLLKGLRPEKYRERHEVAHSGEIKGGVLVVPTPVAAEEWSAVASRQQALLKASTAAQPAHSNGNGNGNGNGRPG